MAGSCHGSNGAGVLVLVLLGLTALTPSAGMSTDEPLTAGALTAGDVLFRRGWPDDDADGQLRGAIVRVGELALGEPIRREQPLHVAIYVGGGELAEAWGRDAADARVDRRRLDGRRGVWRVLRHRDPEVSSALAEVAGRWANGRMRFALPLAALMPRPADDRAAARQSAAFDVEGGPPDVDAMFCSELVVAALRSATLHVHRTSPSGGGHLGARLDPHATPSELLRSLLVSGAFDEVGMVVVR